MAINIKHYDGSIVPFNADKIKYTSDEVWEGFKNIELGGVIR